jgi:hypothetical protein
MAKTYPAAKMDGNTFVLAAKKYNLDDKDMSTMNEIVNEVNKGSDPDTAALTVAKRKGKSWTSVVD